VRADRRNARAGSPPPLVLPLDSAGPLHWRIRTEEPIRSEPSGEFRKFRPKPEAAGTNTRCAPRRHAPRRPCCSLCSAVLVPAGARQLPGAFRWELAWSLATSCGPLVPRRRIAPSPSPTSTEAAGNEERRFYSETAGVSMKLRKPVRLHTNRNAIARTHVDLFQAQSADFLGLYGGRVASRSA